MMSLETTGLLNNKEVSEKFGIDAAAAKGPDRLKTMSETGTRTKMRESLERGRELMRDERLLIQYDELGERELGERVLRMRELLM